MIQKNTFMSSINIIIVGAGPVGLLTSCLLSFHKQIKVKIYEKRIEYLRKNGVKLSNKTLFSIIQFMDYYLLGNDYAKDDIKYELNKLKNLLNNLAINKEFTSINVIEKNLKKIALKMGVEFVEKDFNHWTDIKENCYAIIGCDGTHSQVKRNIFKSLYLKKSKNINNIISDTKFNDQIDSLSKFNDFNILGYLAQVKFNIKSDINKRGFLSTSLEWLKNTIHNEKSIINFESIVTSENSEYNIVTLSIPVSITFHTFIHLITRRQFISHLKYKENQYHVKSSSSLELNMLLKCWEDIKKDDTHQDLSSTLIKSFIDYHPLFKEELNSLCNIIIRFTNSLVKRCNKYSIESLLINSTLTTLPLIVSESAISYINLDITLDANQYNPQDNDDTHDKNINKSMKTHIFLVGDSRSTVIYRNGINKGWMESILLSKYLLFKNENEYINFDNECNDIYEQFKNKILKKQIFINNSKPILQTCLIGGICYFSIMALIIYINIKKKNFKLRAVDTM